jgi:hypothetical protein
MFLFESYHRESVAIYCSSADYSRRTGQLQHNLSNHHCPCEGKVEPKNLNEWSACRRSRYLHNTINITQEHKALYSIWPSDPSNRKVSGLHLWSFCHRDQADNSLTAVLFSVDRYIIYYGTQRILNFWSQQINSTKGPNGKRSRNAIVTLHSRETGKLLLWIKHT